MGIALYHEVKPARSSPSPLAGEGGRAQRDRVRGREKSRQPTLDEMGPGIESIPAKRNGPRSTLGRPGMRGGFKPRRR
jgi:excinuclease ABC subunit B